MNKRVASEQSLLRAIWRRMPRLAEQLKQGVGQAVTCNTSKMFAVVNSERAVRGAAKAHGPFQHRVEHRCQITACAAKFSSSAICFSVNGRTSWRYAWITPSS